MPVSKNSRVTKDYTQYQTPSGVTRLLRSSSGSGSNGKSRSRSKEWAQSLLETVTEQTCIPAVALADAEGTDTVRRRSDIGVIDSCPTHWRRGMIVQFPHVVPNLDPNTEDPRFCVHTDTIGNVCAKIRKAIVIQIYPDKMIVLPIFSSNKRGVERKPGGYKLLSMPVANRRWATNGPDEEVLYVQGNYRSKIGNPICWDPSAGSHINLNEPLTCRFAWPLNDVEMLEKSSLELLARRYKTVQHLGTMPLDDQWDIFTKQRAQDQAQAKYQNAAPKPKPDVDAEGFQTVPKKR